MGESFDSVRLNLGCGNKLWKDFINVDFPGNYSGMKPDVETDLRKLPFKDNYADEIHAIHVLEHFYVWEIEDVLNEWKRVLKPEGLIVLELPCLEKIIKNFQENPKVNLTMWGLYGDPKYKDPNMVHKWAYTRSIIEKMLGVLGFYNVQREEPQYHVKIRDMRITARKSRVL